MKVVRSPGYTLIELLVVVAIAAVLAGILFPVFAQVREAGRRAVCISNVRQLGHAWLAYTQDYDEMTPGGAYARFADKLTGESTGGKRYTPLWVLLPYVRSDALFVCPTRLGWDFSTTNPALDTHRPRQGSYATNYELVEISDAQVSEPATYVLFCDSYNPWQNCSFNCPNVAGGGSSFIWDRIGRGCYRGDCSKRTDWHNGGISLAFADGHVKWRPLSLVFYRNWVRDLPSNDVHYDRPITMDW